MANQKGTTAIFWVLAALLVADMSRAEFNNGPVPDGSLIRYILRSSAHADLETATRCFNTYVPILNQVNKDYMEAYQKCTEDAEDRTRKLEDDALANRRQIELAADSVCVKMDACGESDDSLSFFECFSDLSNIVPRELYEVTHNSSAFARDLRNQYLVSNAELTKCQRAAKRVHVEATAQTYKDLDICLRGGNSSTDQPGTTTPTTPTTTEATTTDGPSSTTTEAPGTLPPYEPDDPNEPREYKFDRNLKILPHLRKFFRSVNDKVTRMHR